jgi:hypothetical protein
MLSACAPLRTLPLIFRRRAADLRALADAIERLVGGDPISAFRSGRMVTASRAAFVAETSG